MPPATLATTGFRARLLTVRPALRLREPSESDESFEPPQAARTRVPLKKTAAVRVKRRFNELIMLSNLTASRSGC